MARSDATEIEKRLNDGEWLRIGDLMILFGASRSAVDRWLRKGANFPGGRLVIRYRVDPSGDRLCMPEDIQAVLAESRKIHSADDQNGDVRK